MFAVFPVSVVTQLIAYYTSVERGLDVDRPRNLAKSVTGNSITSSTHTYL